MIEAGYAHDWLSLAATLGPGEAMRVKLPGAPLSREDRATYAETAQRALLSNFRGRVYKAHVQDTYLYVEAPE